MLPTIKKQIEWYYEHCTDTDPDKLQEVYDRLSANLFFFIEEFDEANKDFVTKYNKYRGKRAETWLKTKYGKTEKVTDSQAERETDRETSIEFADRLFAETHLDVMKEQINAIKAVLRVIEARIIGLRTEFLSSKK